MGESVVGRKNIAAGFIGFPGWAVSTRTQAFPPVGSLHPATAVSRIADPSGSIPQDCPKHGSQDDDDDRTATNQGDDPSPPSIEVGLAERALVTDLGVRGPDPGNPLDEVEQHESDPIGN